MHNAKNDTQKSKGRSLTIVQALREALREEMNRNPEVFVIGEDVRIGGSFLFTLGLLDDYGPDRVINTPISETGFIGLSIGAAIQGMRPIVDFQYGDFILTAFDQIAQEGSKLRYMSGGTGQGSHGLFNCQPVPQDAAPNTRIRSKDSYSVYPG